MQLLQRVSEADLRLLRIYKTVIEAGGFAAAEVSLSISRSAISIAMNDLETRLGMRLCSRGRAGFAVTEQGDRVYQASLRLFAAVENFRADVNDSHTDLKGEFNIGITDNLVTMPHMHITNSLGQLKQQAPKVRINISMIPTVRIEQNILDGQLHAGVVANHHQLPELAYLPLYEEESLLYCSQDHPLFTLPNKQLAKAITKADAIAPSYVQSSEIKRHYQQLNTTATATDREGVAFLILTGQYIGFLPSHYAQQWVDAKKMKVLDKSKFSYSTHFSVISQRARRQQAIVERWYDNLRTNLTI